MRTLLLAVGGVVVAGLIVWGVAALAIYWVQLRRLTRQLALEARASQLLREEQERTNEHQV